MSSIEIKNNGGTKIITPVTVSAVIVGAIISITWGAATWSQSVVKKCDYEKDQKELAVVLDKLNDNITEIKLTLRSKGFKIIRVNDE